MSRIDIGKNMRSPKTEPATPEGFFGYVDDPETVRICAELADALAKNERGELDDKAYKEVKKQKKIGSHFYTPHAHFCKLYKSNEGGPVDSGKAIIDLDGCRNFPELYTSHLMGRERQLGINMVNRSMSGTGGHVLFDIPEGLSRQQAQAWMAHELGDVTYDQAVHELERGIFIPCRDYILYIDEELMFADELHPAVLSEEELARWSGRTQNVNLGSDAPISQQGQALCVPVEPSARALAAFDETLSLTGLTLGTLNQEGIRHNTLKLLLPTLCQMMPQEELLGVIAQKMPDYANEKDCRVLVSNFYEKYVDQNRPMNLRQQEVFLKSLKATTPAESMEVQPGPKFVVKVSQLPIGLREILRKRPENLHLPLLVGQMPVMMALADRVTVRYCDGKMMQLGGMAIIIGEQASNKSAVEEAVELWLVELRQEDKAVREREDKVREANRMRKANERAQPAPAGVVRVVPITISCSKLLKRLKQAQEHCLFSITTEAETLLKTNNSGAWAQKWDIYRNAFGREWWGTDFNSDQSESGDVKVAYNWTILGTPRTVRRMFSGKNESNAENGLSSRCMVSEMPDSMFARMTVFEELSEYDKEQVEKAVQILRSASGFYDTPRLRKAISQWVEEKRIEASQTMDRIKDVYRRRAAVIGFRCGVVCMLLEGKETKRCIEFAVMMAEYTLYMQLRTFGPLLLRQYARDGDYDNGTTVNGNIFAQLPSPFSLQNLRMLKGREFADGTLYSIISRWKADGWVEKSGKDKWTKILEK